MFRHIPPNAIGTIVVNATFQVADAILTVVACPTSGWASSRRRPTGAACSTAASNRSTTATGGRSIPAGVAIILVVIAFNFIGDALRDAFEVRLQRRDRPG